MIGNLDSALALRHAREVLETLASEWPDIQIRPRTFAAGDDGPSLLEALSDGRIGLAILPGEQLPALLPPGVALAAVTRRLEARSALVARKADGLGDLAAAAAVGVLSERDGLLLRALLPGPDTPLLDRLEQGLQQVKNGELDGLIVPANTLKLLGFYERATPLDPRAFTPAAGQGAVAVLASEDDDMAAELAYSLQHRPSFDRVRAEHAFAAALGGHVSGALATVTDDGELTLFASALSPAGGVVQATVSGEAVEAVDLGRELAEDVLEQFAKL